MPPAQDEHSSIVHAIYEALRTVLPAGRVRMESGYKMSRDTWLQPDGSVMWPDQPVADGYRQGSPMTAVEVVSPGNAAEEIQRKTAEYLKYGAEEVWIVYPRSRCMMVHRRTAVERITDSYTCALLPVTISLSDILPSA